MKKIISNSIKTPDGTILTSTHVHDFVQYTDNNGEVYFTDGGNEYLRRSVNKEPAIDLSIYIDDDFDKVRVAFTWGTYGKKGDQPLKRVSLKDLELDHINAILETQTHLSVDIRSLFIQELEFRN
jgi:hypothetical protein